MTPRSDKLLLYILIIILTGIIINLSNNIQVSATSSDLTENDEHNSLQKLCNHSIINCLSIFLHIDEERGENRINISSIIDLVNSTRMESTIDILSSFHTRHTKSHNLEKVVDWLKIELQNICADKVFLQNYTRMDQNKTLHLNNIICKKQGVSSSPYNNTIIIGAHYDSRSEKINDTEVRAPGADDNASGVSALLELAHILIPMRLNNNIEFVLFSGEEQGQWGSFNFVKNLDDNKTDGRVIELYLNLDMIGYPPSSDQTNKVIVEYDVGNKHVKNDKISKEVALFIQQIASDYTNLRAVLGKLGNSDFNPFEALGYTVIGMHDGGENYNPNYHKSSDTANTLDTEYFTSITRMTLATILKLDKLNKYMN
ncbi:MAG: M28 family metallopeptidase [Nitrososphaeraceae archaeon]